MPKASTMFRTSLRFTSALALVAACAAPALAQQAAATDEESGLRDIVVTAQKRSENIQSVPVAVSALDAKALSQGAVDDIRDLAGRVPGLVVDNVNAGPSAAAIAIRGISFEDIEKSFDPAVGVVVDGVFIGTNTGQLLDAFDLESIEVLRGPQGTLFGRNTIGGVINVRRSKPTGEFGVKGSIGYADFETWRGRLVVNTPKIANILSLKGYFNYDDTAGYLYNAFQKKTQGAYRTISGGVTARIDPTDNINVLVNYEHSKETGETATASTSEAGRDLICLRVPIGGGQTAPAFGTPAAECGRWALPDHGLYTIFQNIATPVSNKTDSITGEINIKLGSFDLVSITGWRKNHESVRQDFDSTSINFFDTLRVQDYKQFSEELRVVGNITDNINLLVGAYYFDSSYTLRQNTNLGFVGAKLFQLSGVSAKSYAAFADAKFKLTDRLTLAGGGRYTRDEKSIFSNFALSADGSCPVGFLGIKASDCVGSKSWEKFTWRASADYEIGDHQLIYASYSKGFRSGGFNGRASTPAAIGPYEPETVNAYEAGLKADWLDRTLRTNIAVFRTDYTNKQEETVEPTPPPYNVINPQQTVVRNAASARISGIEFEVTAKPVDAFTFSASFAYLDAKYKKFFRDVNGDLIPDDVSTLQLRRAPKYTLSVGGEYTHALAGGNFDLSAVFRYTDKYTTCIVANTPVVLGAVTNDFRCLSDSREILDATASYTMKISNSEVKFSIYGRNLLDDRGIGSTLPVAGLFTFSGVRPPRQIGGEISFKF